MKYKNLQINFDSNKLSFKQKFYLSRLSKKDSLLYALSLSGIRQTIHSVEAIRGDLLDTGCSPKPLVRDNRGHFLRLADQAYNLGNTVPRTKSFYYGIEIECTIPFESMGIDPCDSESGSEVECSTCDGRGTLNFRHRDSGHELNGDCPDCEGRGEVYREDEEEDGDYFAEVSSFFERIAKKQKIKGLEVKRDGSIEADSEECPVELTLLVRKEDLSSLEKLCNVLNELGAKVNPSCGLHVHLDARHMSEDDRKKAAKRFQSSLKFLSQMVPKSRRENRYCKMSVSKNEGDRYHAVNLTALKKYGTIEVRMHSATTSFLKIKNWIEILSAIHTKDLSHRLTSFKSFFKFIGASESLQEYIKERVEKFGGSLEESELNEPNCNESEAA